MDGSSPLSPWPHFDYTIGRSTDLEAQLSQILIQCDIAKHLAGEHRKHAFQEGKVCKLWLAAKNVFPVKKGCTHGVHHFMCFPHYPQILF